MFKQFLIQKYKNVRKWRVTRNSAQLKIKNNNGLFLSAFNLKHDHREHTILLSREKE